MSYVDRQNLISNTFIWKLRSYLLGACFVLAFKFKILLLINTIIMCVPLYYCKDWNSSFVSNLLTCGICNCVQKANFIKKMPLFRLMRHSYFKMSHKNKNSIQNPEVNCFFQTASFHCLLHFDI